MRSGAFFFFFFLKVSPTFHRSGLTKEFMGTCTILQLQNVCQDVLMFKLSSL